MSDAGLPPEPQWLEPPYPTPSVDQLTAQATTKVASADFGISMLRLAAAAAGIVWLVVAMAAFVTEWHTLDTSSGSLGGFADAGTPSAFWRLTTSISFSGQASWGYAVAAAVLFSATVWFSREQARDALDVLDELDESEGSGGSDGQS